MTTAPVADENPFGKAPAAPAAPPAASPTPASGSDSPGYQAALAEARKVFAQPGNTVGLATESGMLLGAGPQIDSFMIRAETAVDNMVAAAQGKHSKYTSDEAARAVQAAAREALDKYGKDHPVGAFANDFLASFATPGVGWVNDAMKLRKVRPLFRAMGIGGALGGGRGLFESDGKKPGDRAAATAEGAVGGAVTGGVLHQAGHLAGKALERAAPALKGLTGTVRSRLSSSKGDDAAMLAQREASGRTTGREMVQRRVKASDPTGEKLTRNPAEAAGKDVTAAEALGRHDVARLGGAARHKGNAADALISRVQARQEETSRRISDKVAKVAGLDADAIEGRFEKHIEEREKAAKPAIDAFHAQKNIDSPELQAIRKTKQFSDAIQAAEGRISAGRKSAYELGLEPTPQGDSGKRIATKAGSLLGLDADAINGDFEKVLEGERTAAKPEYDAWHGQTDIESEDLSRIRKTPAFRDAMAIAAKTIRNEHGDPVTEGLTEDDAPLMMLDPTSKQPIELKSGGKPILVPKAEAFKEARRAGFVHPGEAAEEKEPLPTAKAYDYVKRAMDRVINAAKKGRASDIPWEKFDINALTKLRGELNAALTDETKPWGPVAAKAFAAGGDAPRLQEAYSKAGDLMDNKVTDAEFARVVKRFDEGQKKALAAGLANWMRDTARGGRMNLNQLMTPLAQDKLRLIFGHLHADELIKFIESERNPVEPEMVPTAEGYDQVLRAMDATLARAPRDSMGRIDTRNPEIEALVKVRDELHAELTNAAQPWGKAASAALEARSHPVQMDEAFHSAKTLMSPSVNQREFERTLDGYGADQMNGLKAGVANLFRDTARGKGIKIENFLNPNAEMKIRRIFGQHAGDAILRDMNTELEMSRSGKQLLRKPIEAAKDQDHDIQRHAAEWYHMAMAGEALTRWNFPMAALHAMRGVSLHGEKFLETPEGKAANDELVRLLSLKPSELAAELEKQGVEKAAIPKATSLLDKLRKSPAFDMMSAKVGGYAAEKVAGFLTQTFGDKKDDKAAAPSDDENPFGKEAPPSDETPQKMDYSEPPPPHAPDEQVSGYLENTLGVPVTITSGFRSEAHNRAVGGVEGSAHTEGEAWDFQPHGMSMEDAGYRLAHSGIPFDQIEITPDHVHISFDPKMRGMVIHHGFGRGGQQVADSGGPDPMSMLPPPPEDGV